MMGPGWVHVPACPSAAGSRSDSRRYPRSWGALPLHERDPLRAEPRPCRPGDSSSGVDGLSSLGETSFVAPGSYTRAHTTSSRRAER
jgi:hypothetical protein